MPAVALFFRFARPAGDRRRCMKKTQTFRLVFRAITLCHFAQFLDGSMIHLDTKNGCRERNRGGEEREERGSDRRAFALSRHRHENGRIYPRLSLSLASLSLSRRSLSLSLQSHPRVAASSLSPGKEAENEGEREKKNAPPALKKGCETFRKRKKKDGVRERDRETERENEKSLFRFLCPLPRRLQGSLLFSA